MWEFYDKLWPLLLPLFLGFLAGRARPTLTSEIAWLLIYLLSPVVIAVALMRSNLRLEDCLSPLLFFFTACISCLFAYSVLGRLFRDNTRNLLAFTSGTGNTGYFGLPIILALFGESQLGIAVLATLGIIVYESTLGYYIIARGNFSSRDALQRLLKLPAIPAMIFGAVWMSFQWPIPQALQPILQNFIGTYAVLGTALVGVGISKFHFAHYDGTFVFSAGAMKFLFFPLCYLSLIMLLGQFGIILNPKDEQTLFALACVPLAANTVAFAESLKVHPEKATVAVVITSLVSLILIPVWMSLAY